MRKVQQCQIIRGLLIDAEECFRVKRFLNLINLLGSSAPGRVCGVHSLAEALQAHPLAQRLLESQQVSFPLTLLIVGKKMHHTLTSLYT